jgi:hypothetical protein
VGFFSDFWMLHHWVASQEGNGNSTGATAKTFVIKLDFGDLHKQPFKV